MQIDVQLKVDVDNIQSSNRIAYGWVELEGCIKFPVNVRKYIDRNDNKEKMFVSYPQKKSGSGYEYVCIPTDPKIREEIDQKVLSEMSRWITKSIQTVPIEDVRVTLLAPGKGLVKNVGLATVKLAGCQISGIVIKEGQRGLFCQMPQHISQGEYTDTVYATNSMMQHELTDAVIGAYQQKLQQLQEQQLKTVVEQEASLDSFDRFLNCYEKNDRQGMLNTLYESSLEITQTGLDDNDDIEFQEAVIRKDHQTITIVFNNTQSKDLFSSEIFAFVPKNGGSKSVSLLENSGQASDRSRIYKEMAEKWNQITKPLPDPVPKANNPHTAYIRPNALMTQPHR